MRIGIDVDLVVVASDTYWLRWLQKVTGKTLNFTPTNYDLTVYFKEELAYNGLSGFEWWRGENIYDNMLPYGAAAKTIHSWKEQGDEIIFISAVKGNHNKSKYYFLKNFFDFDAYVATKEKHVVDVDVMIDDREDTLNKFADYRPMTIPILFPTNYNMTFPFAANDTWEYLQLERETNFDTY